MANTTYLQILRHGLNKGIYGRCNYKGNPQLILSDLTRALTLTCGLEFEQASVIATEIIADLKGYERETYQRMKQESEQMMRAK